MSPETPEPTETTMSQPNPGLYSPRIVARYDFLVIYRNHPFVWRVSNRVLRRLYAGNIGERHLDVGPGSGYFLHTLPSDTPLRELSLLDINDEPLRFTRARVQDRFEVRTYPGVDALGPWPLADDSLDSVGTSMMLHTLPRPNMRSKANVFDEAARVLRPGGRFFGATVLGSGEGVRHGFFARRALGIYHSADNCFRSTGDTSEDLKAMLEERFDDVRYTVQNSAAIWQATAR
ncbi:hypothetical protein GCM10027294_22830 [Marinactinospora endophytica]